LFQPAVFSPAGTLRWPCLLFAVGLALTVLLTPRSGPAATIHVGPSCSVEQAIDALHGTQGSCNAVGDGLGWGGDTIAIPEGWFPVNRINLDISRSVTIEGQGRERTFLEVNADAAGGAAFRVSGSGLSVTLFNLALTTSAANSANQLAGVEIQGVPFTLANAVIRNFGDSGIRNIGGTAYIYGSTVEFNGQRGPGAGGGILNVSSGQVYLWSAVIMGNWAWYGGGIANFDATVWSSYSQITGNGALGDGGGVYTAGGPPAEFYSTVIDSNYASYGKGGGVYLGFSELKLHECTIRNNSAPAGGGVAIDGGGEPSARAEISSSLIADNFAENEGGGIWSTGQLGPVGGHSTISGNTAATGGGLWHTSGGEFNLSFCTIARNKATAYDGVGGIFVGHAGQSTFGENLVADNEVEAYPGERYPSDIAWNNNQFPGTNRNLIGFGNETLRLQFPAANDNLVGGSELVGANPIDPALALDLQNLGGPTPVLALCPGSPAIDWINPAHVGTFGHGPDQRGPDYRRPGEYWDIGAFELGPDDAVAMCP
jgi:hypothetical protein